MNLPVFAYDSRGHGKSGGQRGHFNSWPELEADLDAFLTKIVQTQLGSTRLILFGNSWGGLQVAHYLSVPVSVARNNQIIGAIVNAPALKVIALSPPLNQIVNLLGYLAPRFSINEPISGSKVTRDKVFQLENDQDDMIHGHISMSLGKEIMAAGNRVLKSDTDFSGLPVLLLQGGQDPIISAKANIEFFAKVAEKNPRVKVFTVEEGLHELFTDIEREKVFSTIRDFVLSVSQEEVSGKIEVAHV